ncbi:hypothetical protein MMC25_005368 [Agyrium rufum]|nr:hypothetical protein [Agyrium rufum]
MKSYFMKEAIVFKGPRVELIDSPIPTAELPHSLVIKVIVSGSNPKDWKFPEFSTEGLNQGDDIAGIVVSVGAGVLGFRTGDRVAALHQLETPGGSYAEFAVSWDYTTFHIPDEITFEEAATIPLACMTAAVGLYKQLSLPEPWQPTLKPLPILIYGGSSAVGAFAIKLARLSNMHPIITVAGSGSEYVNTLLDPAKGDVIIDYRYGKDAVLSGIKEAMHKAGVSKLMYAFDTVAVPGVQINIGKVLDPHGFLTSTGPINEEAIPTTVTAKGTSVDVVHSEISAESPEGLAGVVVSPQAFGHAIFQFVALALQRRMFTGHPWKVVPGGLNAIEGALKDLKAGKASAVKYVFRISETSTCAMTSFHYGGISSRGAKPREAA